MRSRQVAILTVILSTVIGACERGKVEAGSSESRSRPPEPTLAVKDVDLGRTINADKSLAGHADDFRPKETIYVSVATVGTASGTLKARWTGPSGAVIDETTEHISPKGPEHTEFHISRPAGFALGKYRVVVFLNDNQVGSKDFEIKRK